MPTGSKGWGGGEKIDRYRLAHSAFLRKVKLKGCSVCPMKLTVSLKDGLKTRERTEGGMTYQGLMLERAGNSFSNLRSPQPSLPLSTLLGSIELA